MVIGGKVRAGRRRLVHLVKRVAACALLSGIPALATAQEGGSISGRTVDSATRQPLSGVTVSVAGTARLVLSDSAGRFSHRGLAAGTYIVEAHLLGYSSASLSITLTSGEAIAQEVKLSVVPTTLPRLVVKDRAPAVGHRFDDFERRRASGRGQFLTRTQIDGKNAMNLSDLLQGMRGIRTECIGFTCTIRSARAMKGCAPAYFVDGRQSTVFGPLTPIRDIQGVEVYLGPSETPPEFQGNDSSCGVIALWTKSSPY